MPTSASPNRWLQFAAAAIISIFVLGFAFSPLSAWTGAVLGAWFVGTQKPWRGFLWLAGINLILDLISNWRGSALNGIEYAGWTMLAVVIGTLPFLFYRVASQRRQDFLVTFSLPLWGVALLGLLQFLLPASVFKHYSIAQTQSSISPLAGTAILGTGGILFLIYWLAAGINWMWNQEFRANKIATGASIFAAVFAVVLGYGFFAQITHAVAPHALLSASVFAWVCFAGGLILSVWNLIQLRTPRKAWANKKETLALLRSPYTGASLDVVNQGGHEVLVSQSGERFPIRNGIPAFLEPEKVTGSNHKYNLLYETIGGFYDDIQRVACALRGTSVEKYLWSYLRFLEVKHGDSVLETSVGTGLNYKYLPQGTKLYGLDLSAEMLLACQANLRRWEMDADLFLGNAEELPFANDSFDVVFHVGGINFFNERAKAIREMIRVAKPGSRLLISDETEEHVKSMYERSPGVGKYFKNRREPVTAPVDLVPTNMQEISLEILRNGRFYALTFRKPAAVPTDLALAEPLHPTRH